MKKIVIFFLVVAALGITWGISRSGTPDKTRSTTTSKKQQASAQSSNGSGAHTKTFPGQATTSTTNGDGQSEESIFESDDRPATDIYEDASSALSAVKKGAQTYDDIVLDQFVNLGDDCTWCNDFYGSIKELIADKELDVDEKSYYAEILAISGRKENVGELINAIKSTSSAQDSGIFAEALEMTTGGTEVLELLGSELRNADDEDLKESIIAAISNQGSSQAVQLTYEYTIEAGNPDGYYSAGTGLGEIIPENEAFPFLREKLSKKDGFSHLAAKSLINAGIDGVKSVVEVLETNNISESELTILKDTVDHVNFDEETEKYFKEVVSQSENPALVQWSQDVLESFEQEEELSESIEEEFN